MGEFLARAAVPAAVLAAFALFRRYMPPSRKRHKDLDDVVPADGAAVYGVMILIDIVFALVTYECQLQLNHVLATLSGSAAFYIFPEKAMWWFFPMLGALTLGWELTDRIWTAFGAGDAFAAYAQNTYEQAGFDSGRACLWLAAVVALPIGIAFLLATPIHTAIRSNGIDIAGFASLHEWHDSYSDLGRFVVVAGYLNDTGTFIANPKVFCLMKDGSKISFSANLDGGKQADQSLISYLQSHIPVPAEYVGTEAELKKQVVR